MKNIITTFLLFICSHLNFANTINKGDLLPPNAPTNFRVVTSTTTYNRLSFAWNASTTLGLRYRIYYQRAYLPVSTTTHFANYVQTFADITSYDLLNLKLPYDYNFYIVALTAGNEESPRSTMIRFSPVPSNPSGLRRTNTTTNSVTLTWNIPATSERIIAYTVFNGSAALTTTNTNTVTISNLRPGTSYTLLVNAMNYYGNISGASTINVSTYCLPSSTAIANINAYMTNVELGSIDRFSSFTGQTYTDNSAISTNLNVGSSNRIIVTVPNALSSDSGIMRGYIDWDQDGVFETGEVISFGRLTLKGAGQSSIDVGLNFKSNPFTVPTTAPNGRTKMRLCYLRKQNTDYTAGIYSCGINGFGEVEDYTINVINSVSARTTDGTEPVAETEPEDIEIKLTDYRSVQLYPNPVIDGILNIGGFENANAVEYSIYNLQGQKMLHGKLENQQINIQSLQKGNYFIEFIHEKGNLTKQFIKQ
jgi:hypothetical protein